MLLGRYINIDFDDTSVLDSNDSNKKKYFNLEP